MKRNKTNQYVYGFTVYNKYPGANFFGNGEITLDNKIKSSEIHKILNEFAARDVKVAYPNSDVQEKDITFLFISLVNTKCAE